MQNCRALTFGVNSINYNIEKTQYNASSLLCDEDKYMNKMKIYANNFIGITKHEDKIIYWYNDSEKSTKTIVYNTINNTYEVEGRVISEVMFDFLCAVKKAKELYES